MDAALRNSPRGVDKAGGHGLSHSPKITVDTKIPWDPKSGAKLVLEELSGPSWSDDDEEEQPEGGRVARKAEAWLEAPLENARAGLCLAGSGLRRLPSSGPWDTPAAGAQLPARDTR